MNTFAIKMAFYIDKPKKSGLKIVKTQNLSSRADSLTSKYLNDDMLSISFWYNEMLCCKIIFFWFTKDVIGCFFNSVHFTCMSQGFH